MYISLKKEVRAYSDKGYIIIKNNISGAFRVLSPCAALLIFLLKGICTYKDVEKKYIFLTENKKTDIDLVLNNLKPYINLGEIVFEVGINELTINDVVSCRKLNEISQCEYPTSVFLNATNTCDKNCKYCSEKQQLNTEKKSDFPLELVEKIFNNLGNSNCFFELTGGEPLLHSELIKLLKKIKDFKVPICFITKATDDLSFFKKVLLKGSIARVCFSIDSFRKKYVDYITGRNGTFNNIIGCMNIARKCGTTIDVNVVITALNENEIERMVVFCIDHRVETVHFTTVWPTPSMDRDLVINESRNQIIYNVVNQLRDRYKKQIDIELTTTKCENRCEKCGKALTDVKIDCKGEVSLCNGMVIGNLYNACLFDIWNSETTRKMRCELMGQMAT